MYNGNSPTVHDMSSNRHNRLAVGPLLAGRGRRHVSGLRVIVVSLRLSPLAYCLSCVTNCSYHILFILLTVQIPSFIPLIFLICDTRQQ